MSTTLRRDLETEKRRYGEPVKEAREHESVLESRVVALNKENDTLTSAKGSLEKEYADLRSRVAELEKQKDTTSWDFRIKLPRKDSRCYGRGSEELLDAGMDIFNMRFVPRSVRRSLLTPTIRHTESTEIGTLVNPTAESQFLAK